MLKNQKRLASNAIKMGMLLLIVGLEGCLGGSGGTTASTTTSASTLSGVVAVGTPIASSNIIVVCAAGSNLTTASGIDGSWTVTISGQTLPCAAEATDGTINSVANTTAYHSVATATGTMNITPLTDLLVANLAGSTPSTWFAGLSTSTTPLTAVTSTKVNTALSTLSSSFSGLTQLATTNPISTTFTPTSGNVSDDMLTALATTTTNTGVSYATLLSNTATGTAIPASVNTQLTTTYASTTSGSSAVTGTWTMGPFLDGDGVSMNTFSTSLVQSGNSVTGSMTMYSSGSWYGTWTFLGNMSGNVLSGKFTAVTTNSSCGLRDMTLSNVTVGSTSMSGTYSWSASSCTASSATFTFTKSTTAQYSKASLAGTWFWTNFYITMDGNGGVKDDGIFWPATPPGSYTIQADGSYVVTLSTVSPGKPQTTTINGALTSATAGTWSNSNGSGTATKVSNLAACQGVWSGTLTETAGGTASSTVYFTIDSTGTATALTGLASPFTGKLYCEAGAVNGFLRTNETTYNRQIQVIGTLSGNSITGTYQTDSGSPKVTGTVTLTR